MLLREKVKLIRKAAEKQRVLTFNYKDLRGNWTSRRVEPYSWRLRGDSLILGGHCRDKDSTRTFYVNRMQELRVSGEVFIPRHKILLGGIEGSGI